MDSCRSKQLKIRGQFERLTHRTPQRTAHRITQALVYYTQPTLIFIQLEARLISPRKTNTMIAFDSLRAQLPIRFRENSAKLYTLRIRSSNFPRMATGGAAASIATAGYYKSPGKALDAISSTAQDEVKCSVCGK